jgi:CrcB protein
VEAGLHLIYIALGGALGSLLRHFAAMAITSLTGTWLSWGIMVVNITGSFVIGCAAGGLTQATTHSDTTFVRYFVIVGLCGGYTTFSSFSLYTVQLIHIGAIGRAFLYMGLSVFACVAATALGYALAAGAAR